jgi:cytochrome c oxidase assembly protein subunit 11
MADLRLRENRQMLGKLAVVAAIMFGFGWALIPIYKKICQVSGVNVLTKRDEGAARFAANTQVDVSRSVTVELDANVQGPWRFNPEQRSIEVHP